MSERLVNHLSTTAASRHRTRSGVYIVMSNDEMIHHKKEGQGNLLAFFFLFLFGLRDAHFHAMHNAAMSLDFH